MTTNADTQDLARAIGQLEGRVAEHSVQLHQLRSDMTSGFDQMNMRFDQMNVRFDQMNDRIHRLLLTVIAIGGGVIAALIAMLITLIVQG